MFECVFQSELTREVLKEVLSVKTSRRLQEFEFEIRMNACCLQNQPIKIEQVNMCKTFVFEYSLQFLSDWGAREAGVRVAHGFS